MIAAFLRHSLFLIAATVVGLLITVLGASADERECPVPERFYEFEPLVTKTVKAFAGRREVVIAVLGGASTMGVAAGGLEFAWPARLASALIQDFPEYYPLYSQKEFRYNNITQANRNRLLWTDPYVDGVKTGHTEAAGWCLVASAKRGDRRLVSVVLGAASDSSRAAESQKLLNRGFQAFDTVALYQSGKPVTTLRVWKGAKHDVNAGFVADRYLTLPKGKADKLALTLESKEPLIAPVLNGQPVGVVKVALEGQPVAQFPMIALEEVPLANLWGRAVDTVRLWFTSR